MTILHLSNDLQLFITSFLDYEDQINYGSICIKFVEDLLSCHLRQYKISSTNQFYQNYYYNNNNNEQNNNNDQTFREKFHKIIKNPEKQIVILTLHQTILNNHCFPFHSIKHLYCDNIEYFHDFLSCNNYNKVKKIHSLSLSDTKQQYIHQLSFQQDTRNNENDTDKDDNNNYFYYLQSLDILYWHFNDPAPIPMVLPPLLRRLTLRGLFTGLTKDILQQCSYLQELRLSDLDSLTDVSILNHIKILQLENCRNITNLTSLQDNDEVILSYLQVLDYRHCFRNSRRITITSPCMHALFDFTHYEKVKYLSITHTPPMPIVEPLSTLPSTLKQFISYGHSIFTNFNHLFELSIEANALITSVELFGRIPVLRLNHLENVTSLHGLGYNEDPSKNRRNRRVKIYQLHKIADFTPLNNVSTVVIENCKNFERFEDVCHVKDLTIAFCAKFDRINAVEMKNERLTLKGSMKAMINFQSFRLVKVLDVSNLKDVHGLDGMENLHCLEKLIVGKHLSILQNEGFREWELLNKDVFYKFYSSKTIVYLKK